MPTPTVDAPCAWTTQFRAWIATTGQAPADLARALETSRTAVHRWLVVGHMPRLEMRRRIERMSQGIVRA